MKATHTRPGGILTVLAIAGIVASLTQTLVIPLLGQLPQLLHTSAANATWVVTATLLVGAVVTPISGRLGDQYGKRRILLLLTVPLMAGSVVCALSSALWPMIIGRGLQGMGMGIVPLGIAALRDLLPAERLNSGIALISSSLGIGGALGLPLAAAVVQYSNWRVLFWGIAVLAAVVGALVFALIPDTPGTGAGRFDALGALGLGGGLVCLLLAVSEGATWGWGSGRILGLFAGAVVLLLAWGWWELRVREPLVDLRVTGRPQVLMTNAASVVVGVAMYSQSLIVPQLMQLPKVTGYGLGQSMMSMGLYMAPSGLMMMLVSPVGAKLSALRGPKVTLAVGCLIMAVGYGASMGLMGTPWGLLVVSIIVSSGTGFAYGAMPALIMGAVPLAETAAANAFNTLMRSVGTSAASAVVGAVLAQLTINFAGHTIPSQNGFRTGLLIGCGVAVAGAVIAIAIPVRRAMAAGSVAAEPITERLSAVSGHAAAQPDSEFDGHGVFGRVRDTAGLGVAGATLTLISMSGQQVGVALSDADGSYRLHAPAPGAYALIASAAGRRPDATNLVLGTRPQPCAVTLPGLAGLRGTVLRAGDAAPVAGARVAALDARGEVLGSAETDLDGRFELTELPEGEFVVAVSGLGLQPAALPARITGSDLTPLEIVLRTSGRLRGVIRGQDTRPLPNAQVTLADSGGDVIGVLTTGPDGGYAFDDLDAGDYAVIASGYAPVSHAVRIHGPGAFDVDVELGHRLLGATR